MNNHKSFVVSAGGAGSKLFVSFLYWDLEPHLRRRFHGHYPPPLGDQQNGESYIYLFSDPRDAMVSFFNRRIRRHERHNFQGDPTVNQADAARFSKDWVCRHLVNIGGDAQAVDPTWNLADYFAHTRVDAFRLEAHFCNWLAVSDIPVLFVRYETLWRREAELRDILRLPSKASLPPFVPRAASWQAQPSDLRDRLDAQLGDLAVKLSHLPDIFGRHLNYSAPLAPDQLAMFLPLHQAGSIR